MEIVFTWESVVSDPLQLVVNLWEYSQQIVAFLTFFFYTWKHQNAPLLLLMISMVLTILY